MRDLKSNSKGFRDYVVGNITGEVFLYLLSGQVTQGSVLFRFASLQITEKF